MDGIARDFLIALLTAILTVWFGLRQFRTERWWERQAETYVRILENLSVLAFTLTDWISDQLHEKQLSDEANRELGELYGKSLLAIRTSTAQGSFLVSETTTEHLTKVVQSLDKWSMNPLDALDEQSIAVRNAIRVVRQEALKDLRTTKRSRWRLMRRQSATPFSP